jgi:hypothetical protein
MIVPSNLMAFAKRAGDTLLVNPGRLSKGNTVRTATCGHLRAPSFLAAPRNHGCLHEFVCTMGFDGGLISHVRRRALLRDCPFTP